MNIVFMGTPDFSVPCLKALIESGENVCAVFTQPDKPKGRGMKMLPTPVKEVALTHNIPVYQPKSLKSGEDADKAREILTELSPELIVVVAYGKILPTYILELPKYNCINVHASLLPKYRGAAPIQRSVLDGEKETGVTTMLMAEGIDTGDMLLRRSTPIGENETASELHDRLSLMGAELLLETVAAVKSGSLTPQKQDDSCSCYAAMITKDMCRIDFTKSASEIHHLICGLSDYPCAYSELDGKRLKIYRSHLCDKTYNSEPGTIVNAESFTVVCGGKSAVCFDEVQIEGGKRLDTADFIRGRHIEADTKLT